MLIAMIQLGDHDAAPMLLSLILNSTERTACQYLIQVHKVLNSVERFGIYYELLKTAPDKTEYFMDLLNNTQKDFDQDRGIIYSEAMRLSIKISEDFNLFDKVAKKSAA